MLNCTQSYTDWKDFFATKLVNAGAFQLTSASSKSDTDIETYSALKGDPDTIIQVGYLSPVTLIYVHIFNPATPGKNRQQELEHLYKYEFDTERQYGPPGLDFNEMNVQGISHYLGQGFNGSEIVYYRNGRPIKSKLTTSYYPDSPQSTFTYQFPAESILQRLLIRIFGRQNDYDEIKTVNLRDIFGGLNGR